MDDQVEDPTELLTLVFGLGLVMMVGDDGDKDACFGGGQKEKG